MKIFWPEMSQVPFGPGSALATSAPTSDPAWGSVRFMVPHHSPLMSFGRYVAFCSSDPWADRAWILAWVRRGLSDNAMFAAVNISVIAMPMSHGNPPPPYSGSKLIAPHPAST